MRFHLPSFVIGYAAGAGTILAAHRLRPLLVEVATAFYRLGDTLLARAAIKKEDLEDVLAEARARARGMDGAGLSQAPEETR